MPRDETAALCKCVLVIEDDDAVARALVRVIGKRCQVRHASSLAQGLRLIAEVTYVALIADWDLGDGVGLVALLQSAKHHPEARRVLHSARPSEECAPLVPPGIVDAIVQKPATPAVILDALGLS